MSRSSARPLPSTPFPSSHHRDASQQLQRTPSLRTLLSTARTHFLLIPFGPSILLRILKHLPRSDRATLLRLNSAFYWLVLPVISTHLVLPTHSQWPRLRPLVRPPREFWPWLESHPPPAWVRQVDVLPHSSRRCMVHTYEHETDTEYAPPTANCPDRLPFLPRIQTLRIHGHLHTDERWAGLVPQCAALQNVRPHKLVLLGAPSSSPLTSLPYALLSAVDEYVLVLSSDPDLSSDHEAPAMRARAIASDLAHTTARRATLIFAPHTPWTEFRAGTSVPTTLPDGWPWRLFAELGRQLATLPLNVRIVNAGAIDHRALGLERWDAARGEALLEEHFRDALRSEQAEYRPWRRPRCEVEFASMATYLLDAPDDELGAARLDEWRNPTALLGTPKRPPASLSKSPRTPSRRPAPLKPASRIMSLRTQSGPGSPIAAMAYAVARRASDKMAERRASEKRLHREAAARRAVSEKMRPDENVRWRA